jgi:hypothetical protein
MRTLNRGNYWLHTLNAFRMITFITPGWRIKFNYHMCSICIFLHRFINMVLRHRHFMHTSTFQNVKEILSVRIMESFKALSGLCNGKFISSLDSINWQLTMYVSCIKHEKMFLFAFPLAAITCNRICEVTTQLHDWLFSISWINVTMATHHPHIPFHMRNLEGMLALHSRKYDTSAGMCTPKHASTHTFIKNFWAVFSVNSQSCKCWFNSINSYTQQVISWGKLHNANF